MVLIGDGAIAERKGGDGVLTLVSFVLLGEFVVEEEDDLNGLCSIRVETDEESRDEQ